MSSEETQRRSENLALNPLSLQKTGAQIYWADLIFWFALALSPRDEDSRRSQIA